MPRRPTFPLKKKKYDLNECNKTELEERLKNIVYPAIKERDSDEPCISCQKIIVTKADAHAGHYGAFGYCNPALKWHPLNLNKQCNKCNTFLHSNGIEYRKGLVRKIGIEKVDMIETYYLRPMPIEFNYIDWLIKTITELRVIRKKNKHWSATLNYMEERTNKLLSSLGENS